MGDTIPNRANALRAVIAILVLAAILVAPVCTPICAARECPGAAAQEREEQCHSQGALGDAPGDKYTAPMKACAARELAAVLSRSNNKLVRATQLQDLSVEWELGGRFPDPFPVFGAPVLRWGEDRFVLGPTSFLLQTTHLRF